jgi:hypothetical protein
MDANTNQALANLREAGRFADACATQAGILPRGLGKLADLTPESMARAGLQPLRIAVRLMARDVHGMLAFDPTFDRIDRERRAALAIDSLRLVEQAVDTLLLALFAAACAADLGQPPAKPHGPIPAVNAAGGLA